MSLTADGAEQLISLLPHGDELYQSLPIESRSCLIATIREIAEGIQYGYFRWTGEDYLHGRGFPSNFHRDILQLLAQATLHVSQPYGLE